MGAGTGMNSEIGRLGRAQYWVLLVLLVVAKVVLVKALGSLAVSLATVAVVYFLLSARLHDFGAPSWLASMLIALVYGPSVLVGIYIAATAGPGIQIKTLHDLAQHVSPLMVVLLVGPEPLLLMIAGTIPGHIGRNAYGPPGQGFFGILPRASDGPAASEAQPAASRMASILSRQPTSGADAPRQGGVLAPRTARRDVSPSFGRR